MLVKRLVVKMRKFSKMLKEKSFSSQKNNSAQTDSIIALIMKFKQTAQTDSIIALKMKFKQTVNYNFLGQGRGGPLAQNHS